MSTAPPAPPGWTTVARVAARDLARAVVPVACPGCGLADIRLCGDCAAVWWEAPFRCEDGAGRLDVDGRVALPVWAVTPLAGPAHLAVGAWKNGRRRDLDRFFASAIARAAGSLAGCLDGVGVVVPVPSRPTSTRKRGRDLTLMLAGAVARELSTAGRPVVVRPALRHRGQESQGAGARSRWRSGGGAIDARCDARGEVALLVDDVVTTGASLARSAQALEQVGAIVAAGLVLAATPRPGSGGLAPGAALGASLPTLPLRPDPD